MAEMSGKNVFKKKCSLNYIVLWTNTRQDTNHAWHFYLCQLIMSNRRTQIKRKQLTANNMLRRRLRAMWTRTCAWVSPKYRPTRFSAVAVVSQGTSSITVFDVIFLRRVNLQFTLRLHNRLLYLKKKSLPTLITYTAGNLISYDLLEHEINDTLILSVGLQ